MKKIYAMIPTLFLLSTPLLASMHDTHAWGGWKAPLYIGWWFVASTLLFLTWNKVVVFLTGLKKVKWWQALLFVATIAIFCCPRKYSRYHHGMKTHWKQSEHHMPEK